MPPSSSPCIHQPQYNPKKCDIGFVHLGYGSFHRAHQAQYIEDYIDKTGDLRWGIAAVNIRREDSGDFSKFCADGSGYILKCIAPDGTAYFRRLRPHIRFCDWSQAPQSAEELLTLPSVTTVTITVTESGYYLDDQGKLNYNNPVIAEEIRGGNGQTVYNYLMKAIERRREKNLSGLNVLCCDNIRQNGLMLERNFFLYLQALQRDELISWVTRNVSFPNSMVDRITPRPSRKFETEIFNLYEEQSNPPVATEKYSQWVLEDNFKAPFPDMTKAGVLLTSDLDPYEETKIRILNGGHSCIAYLAALKNIKTFDQAITDPELFSHFINYQYKEVLPALTANTPFDKNVYLEQIIERFKNPSIGDTVNRICADGFLKFPIFIRPTLIGLLKNGITPHYGITSIASWYICCKLSIQGKLPFTYQDANWDKLECLISSEKVDNFIQSTLLWGDMPNKYPQFSRSLKEKMTEMERTWLA